MKTENEKLKNEAASRDNNQPIGKAHTQPDYHVIVHPFHDPKLTAGVWLILAVLIVGFVCLFVMSNAELRMLDQIRQTRFTATATGPSPVTITTESEVRP